MFEASNPPRARLMRVPEDLVKRGLIEVKKLDGATRVVTKSLDRYIDNLPSNISTPSASND
jgi:hypothetical protein